MIELLNLTGSSKTTKDVVFATSIDSNSLTSVDVTDPYNMTILDSYSNSSYIDGAISLCIDTDNKLLFVSSFESNSVTSFDISNPENIVKLDCYINNTYLDGARRIKFLTRNQRTLIVAAYNNDSICRLTYDTYGNITYDRSYSYSSLNAPIDMYDYWYSSKYILFVSNFLGDSITAIDITNTPSEIDVFTDPTDLDAPWGNIGYQYNNTYYLAVSGYYSDNVIFLNITDPSNIIKDTSVTSTYLDSPTSIVATSSDYNFLVPGFNANAVSRFYHQNLNDYYQNNTYLDGPKDSCYNWQTQNIFISAQDTDSVVAFDNSLNKLSTITSSSYLNGIRSVEIFPSLTY